jgi:C-terminal processing protease CtpA/Prc
LGLRRGDRITAINGRNFSNRDSFNTYLRALNRGRVPMEFFRDGQRRVVYFYYDNGDWFDSLQDGSNQGALGVTFQNARLNEVVVGNVFANSPAHRAGLRSGDVIYALNGRRYNSVNGFVQNIASMSPGEQVRLNIRRNGRQYSAMATLSSRNLAFTDGYVGSHTIVTNDRQGNQRQTVLRPNLDGQQGIDELRQEVISLRNSVRNLQNEISRWRNERDPQAPPRAFR